MDLLASNHQASSSSGSSASSHSPRSPPPQTSFDFFAESAPAINTGSPSDFFNFFPQSEDDYSSYSAVNATTKTNGAPFDFMNTMDLMPFSIQATASSSSPSDSSPSAMGNNSGIDPQLVGTPATTVRSDFDADDESGLLVIPEEEEISQEELQEVEQPAPKVAGKGRGGRKGTVASGGVAKKTSSGPSFLKDKENTTGSSSLNGEDDDEDDSWRPTAEEYKKMSSKEKRQLRNKISARNFRVRRKGKFTS